MALKAAGGACATSGSRAALGASPPRTSVRGAVTHATRQQRPCAAAQGLLLPMGCSRRSTPPSALLGSTSGSAAAACPRRSRGVARRQSSHVPYGSSDAAAAGPSLGVFFDLDNAVMDMQLEGHRVAFNNAFQSIGMDCVSWSPIVYHDLLGCSDGTGESLVTSYYNTVGWPMMVATSEQGAFARKIHQLKQKELKKLLQKDAVPLRADVRQVIADAVADGASVAMICGTQSEFAAETAESCQRLLGEELARRVRLFTFSLAGDSDGEAEGDEAPSSSSAAGSSASIAERLAAAASDLKQRQAIQLACSMRAAITRAAAQAGMASEGSSLGIDPSIMAAGGAQQRLTAEYLVALTATLGVGVQRCLMVAAGNATLQAAANAGMVTVAVPGRFSSQGSFPAARAKLDGYGPGLATWPRLRALLLNRQQ